jgi:hypothetical protein
MYIRKNKITEIIMLTNNESLMLKPSFNFLNAYPALKHPTTGITYKKK